MEQIKELKEDQLVAELKKGSKLAFDYLYEQYNGALFGVIFRIVNDQETANDALQESFIKIWKNISNYDNSKASLYTWMLTICRNIAIDVLRSKGYKNNMNNKDIESTEKIYQSESQLGIKPETIGVKELVSNLKNEEQVLINLLYYKGFSQSEVADELNIPLGTVKTKARSAILKLRQYFN